MLVGTSFIPVGCVLRLVFLYISLWVLKALGCCLVAQEVAQEEVLQVTLVFIRLSWPLTIKRNVNKIPNGKDLKYLHIKKIIKKSHFKET